MWGSRIHKYSRPNHFLCYSATPKGGRGGGGVVKLAWSCVGMLANSTIVVAQRYIVY